VPGGRLHGRDDTVARRDDLVLHLHGFENDEHLILAHAVTRRDAHFENLPGHRRREGAAVGGAALACGGGNLQAEDASLDPDPALVAGPRHEATPLAAVFAQQVFARLECLPFEALRAARGHERQTIAVTPKRGVHEIIALPERAFHQPRSLSRCRQAASVSQGEATAPFASPARSPFADARHRPARAASTPRDPHREPLPPPASSAQVIAEEVRRQLAAHECRVSQDRLQVQNVRWNAEDREFAERPLHALQRFLAIASVRDELGEHRIIVNRHIQAVAQRAVDADAGALRLTDAQDAARGRQELVLGILGVDAAFERMAALRGAERGLGKRQTGCHFELQAHEVEPRHELGDRMLDLQARVHLEEVEIAVRVEHELDGAGIAVADGPRGGDGRISHTLPQRRVERR
jgi:hypothetical protein